MRVFPEEAERIPGACGPFAEEDLGRLERLELREEFVVLPKILDGVEECGMGSGAPLDEFPQTPVRDRAPNVADRGEAYVQVVLREEALARGDFLDRVLDADRAEAAALVDLGH